MTPGSTVWSRSSLTDVRHDDLDMNSRSPRSVKERWKPSDHGCVPATTQPRVKTGSTILFARSPLTLPRHASRRRRMPPRFAAVQFAAELLPPLLLVPSLDVKDFGS